MVAAVMSGSFVLWENLFVFQKKTEITKSNLNIKSIKFITILLNQGIEASYSETCDMIN